MRYARKLMFQIIINVPDSKPALINENNHPADLSDPGLSAYFLLILFRLEVIAR